MMGTPAASTGTKSETSIAVRALPKSEMMPSMKPSVNAPESPMKMLAGWKLKRRKPTQAPSKMTASIAAASALVTTHSTKMVMAEMEVMPAARPSRPSIKLMTLAKATR